MIMDALMNCNFMIEYSVESVDLGDDLSENS